MPYVDIELDEFDTDDLIEELENRSLDLEQQDKLLDLIKDGQLKIDTPKMKLFLSVMDK